MGKSIPANYLNRKEEIAAQFMQILNAHIDDFMAGRVNKMYELKEIAQVMCLHPGHVSHIVKLHTGHHACYFYEHRILEEAKKLLADPSLSIKNIAHRLDYDVSNFTKFFKRFTGQTPSAYRKSLSDN
ncbi:helix-turn-helix domain-containing protein [Chitinophaga pinensis]|uniref:Transcriptional regulator, AraC family n=1 Tax=Chitinophaga pinensis (strain ATCC 43595 / DSM 2588 / LMG 13176 / NBRC 15968 / NCIMB 11800 / UQM 2034) TaxID=485918 RepID=A0A979G467_CHIPD|nr:helix-turn-helix domain-containing protein [Chitinophaga pinensis]ACU60311.1 transcriptional regulator, AraC family [Chitinophaga pinensis DSM 2588]